MLVRPARLALILALIFAAPAALPAAEPHEIDVQSAEGLRLFIEPGDAALAPVGRVEAAKSAAGARFGALVNASPTQTSSAGTRRFAESFARFAGDPKNVHTWVALDGTGDVCHIVVPVNPAALQAVKPLVYRCTRELIGQSHGTGGAGESALSAAIRAVPASNQPVAMVLRTTLQFNGGMALQAVKPWALFANGYATDCLTWDPASSKPEPAVLAGPPLRCTMQRWSRSGSGYRFYEKPGAAPVSGGKTLAPFRPGQRIAFAGSTESGNGTGPAVAGVTSVSSVTSGDLKLTATGEIGLGSFTSVNVSGANAAGGAQSSAMPIAGRYYLSGYLIAFADSTGTVHRGFAGIDRAEKTYVYLNGTEYWPPNR